MKILMIGFVFFFLLCCSKKTVPTESTCKIQLLKKVELLGSYIEFDENNIGTCNFDNIELPQGYDTMDWVTEVDTISGINELYARNMIYRGWLKELLNSNCQYKLNIDDFIIRFGEPRYKNNTTLFYRFNTFKDPKCFKFDLSDCSLIRIEYDDQEIIKNIICAFFNP